MSKRQRSQYFYYPQPFFKRHEINIEKQYFKLLCIIMAKNSLKSFVGLGFSFTLGSEVKTHNPVLFNQDQRIFL